MREIRYEGRIFRPPSEAYSLIIQSTIGCSHNGCTFCSMYQDKKFRIRPVEAVCDDLAAGKRIYSEIDRIFLADGDALMRSAESQLEILQYIKDHIPECERVTSYASPKSAAARTDDELAALAKAGLKMVYIGLESGSDRVLEQVNKGASAAEIVLAVQRLKQANIQVSVTAVAGLGGRALSAEHARETGRALSCMKADYIGILSLMLEPGTELTRRYIAGEFELPNANEILEEIRMMLQHTDSEGSVFRANHASNYVNLAGTLNRDKAALISRIDDALLNGRIKDEAWRGL